MKLAAIPPAKQKLIEMGHINPPKAPKGESATKGPTGKLDTSGPKPLSPGAIQGGPPKKHTGFLGDLKDIESNFKRNHPDWYRLIDDKQFKRKPDLGMFGSPSATAGQIKTPFGQKVWGGELRWDF